MRIVIKRNGQTFGPYPTPAVQLYVEQGALLPQDLARLESDSDDDWKPLSRLMRHQNIDSTVLSAGLRPAALLADLRSLDMKLLFPWGDIRSGRWIKDRRVLLFVCVGMLPIVVVSVRPSINLIYLCLSTYFAAIWALYFYQMFKTPEVEPKTAILCFGATCVVAIPLLVMVQGLPPLSLLYTLAMSPYWPSRFVGMTLGVGVAEEACKAAVVYYVASRPGRLLLPQTIVLYGLICGLGFGCVEGVFYQRGVNRQATPDLSYFLNILRLTSLPFLHAVWAGISAYFISFSMVVARKRVVLRVVAILIPAFFHGAYNTFNGGIIGLGLATLSVFFLMSYLASCGGVKSHLMGVPAP